MNSKKSILSILVIFLFQAAEADTLENFGWEKIVDDFEETTSYRVSHENYAYSCDNSSIAAVYGLVMGEISSKPPLTLMYHFTPADDLRSEGTLKWKSDEGSKSLKFACQNDYHEGGWSRQCIVTGITANISDSLANTDFIRIDFPSKNIDLKEEGSTSGCRNLFTETKRLANEHSQAVNSGS